MVPVLPVSSSLPGTTAAFSCWFTRKVPSLNKRRQGPSLLRTSALTFGTFLWTAIGKHMEHMEHL